MNQQPDNFFREKLQDYQKPAPVGAWGRIEATLQKKNKTSGWWKIAASLLLLTTVGYLLQPDQENSDRQPLAEATVENQPSISDAQNNKTQPSPNASKQNLKPLDGESSRKENSNRKKLSHKKTKTQKIKTATSLPESSLELIDKNEIPVVDKSSETEPVPQEQKNENVSKPQNITLKFSVAETNEYLDKNIIAQATSDEKKSSTFKKLLKKANDLKSNQDPFGDLREKKNEILALNFKNEKRGQNK